MVFSDCLWIIWYDFYSLFVVMIYAVKIIHENAPGLIFFRIAAQTSFWFFTGFVKEILFLKLDAKLK